MPEISETEPLLDPDCRDGKHGSCTGGPCGCACHDQCTEGKYDWYGPQCRLEAAHHQRGEPCVWATAGPGETTDGEAE